MISMAHLKKQVFIIVVTITIVASLPTANEVSNDDLKSVYVLFRHGDRTPDKNSEFYPNDPYLNDTFYPVGTGQLTNAGKAREYSLGMELRKSYINFLGKIYLAGLIRGYSTAYDRTRMSMQLVLAALFKPEPVQQFNDKLPWQPIPFLFVPQVEDTLMLGDGCPKYLDEYERVKKLPAIKTKVQELDVLMKNLTIWTGKNITNTLDIYNLYHSLMAEYSMNLPLPHWVYEVFPSGLLLDGIIVEYEIATYTKLLKKLFMGDLLKKITTDMINKKDCKSEKDPKLFLFSGHESNVAGLLNTLGVYTPHVPAYSSAVILELREINNEYFVKVLYYEGIPKVTKELCIPGCDVLCPLNKFLEIVSDFIPTEEDLECDKTKTDAFANVQRHSFLEEKKYNVIKSKKSPFVSAASSS